MGDTHLSHYDLRAAVASGILDEAQAADLLALGQSRAGQRGAMPDEDEPFELFRGFSEIFVAVGLSILFAGWISASAIFGSAVIVLILAGALSFVLARYFTLKRRMTLPSIILVSVFAVSLSGAMIALLDEFDRSITASNMWAMLVCGVTAAGLLIWYRVYRLPFTMFLVGITGVVFVTIVTKSLIPLALGADWYDLFDLRSGYNLAFGTLVFGICAFVAGMWFDMSDPHRLGRRAASGFWLHLLAAPALVNTVALTFWNMQNGLGYALLAVSLVLISALALIIDRRSFLTAGIGYLAVLLGYVLRFNENDGSWILILLILGAFITLLGTYWTQVRGKLLRALPDFPGKTNLPPYMDVS